MKNVAIIVLFVFAAFFATFRLTESPPTWMDEGIIINTARVFSETGRNGLQIAPDTYESAGVVTTSYPATLPVAALFRLFGVGLLQARAVMAAFILLLLVFAFLVERKVVSATHIVPAFLLLVTFPPIYGNGKNVLGEIPALLYFLIFLYLAYRIESGSRGGRIQYGLAGLALGLAVVTKPIFILILPAVAAALLYKYRLNGRIAVAANQAIATTFFVLPFVFWILFQFSGDALGHIISVYSNPGRVDWFANSLSNLKVLFTESQPLYFVILMSVWTLSVASRVMRRRDIALGELVAFFFSILVILAFLRVPAYYRYFFPAQFFALIYFVPSLTHLLLCLPKADTRASLSGSLIYGVAGALSLAQIYSLLFTSWTARYYASDQTAQLERYFREAGDETFFLYQTPELATFVKTENYYQFFSVAPELYIGSGSIRYLTEGVPDRVIVHDGIDLPPALFDKYQKTGQLARYAILTKIR